MHRQHKDTWAFRVSDRIQDELDEFEYVVEQFKSGAINEGQFRIVRVPAGIYEQRENGTYMLRVRFPAGGVTPSRLRRLGEVSAKFGNGLLHITTRQEFQIHRVPLDSIIPALRLLAKAGLSTKGGGGNTVRNITACVDSGVCRDEVFDVTPYAVATTERLLADPLSLQLPRKYKIAFAACNQDCSGATVHDVGFVARKQNGLDGFAVYVAGGMGGKSRLSSLLHEFIPATETFVVAEAIKRVFDKNGDRKNKHLARLRFLVEKIGLPAFRELYEKELAALRAGNPVPLELRPLTQLTSVPENGGVKNESAEFNRWFAHNVAPQKQPGFFLVQIPLTLGDIPAGKAAALADILAAHGDNILWATQSQNAGLRWITAAELPVVHQKLAALGLAEPEAPVLRNLVACAGASTCRLGICLSRGLAKAVRSELSASELDLDRLGDFSIHISGCPNSCGRHSIGNIGFSGAARRVGGNLVPFYAVQLGGRLAEGKSRFGVNVGAVPAKNAPAFVRDLLTAWKKSPDTADFHQFVDKNGRKIAGEILARHQDVPPIASRKEFYYDWDADALFSLAGRGQGECSAGVFDLIEVDLANARESQEAGRFYAAALAAARALLVVQRAQPKNDVETFTLFQKHFIEAGLVDAALTAVIAEGARAAAAANPAEKFDGLPADVAALVASVRLLHENLDSSLRFRTAAK
ncbi:MAG: nitrite/sulfite reductase [Verrucomicrobiota bacterium]|jgi:sulfite reductase (ferredoxin)